MTGHRALIDLRMHGFQPTAVWVFDLPTPIAYTRNSNPENQIFLGHYPVLDILPDDSPGALDLRCLAGLVVHLSGHDTQRVVAILDRAIEFTPARIVACIHGVPLVIFWSPETGIYDVETT